MHECSHDLCNRKYNRYLETLKRNTLWRGGHNNITSLFIVYFVYALLLLQLACFILTYKPSPINCQTIRTKRPFCWLLLQCRFRNNEKSCIISILGDLTIICLTYIPLYNNFHIIFHLGQLLLPLPLVLPTTTTCSRTAAAAAAIVVVSGGGEQQQRS